MAHPAAQPYAWLLVVNKNGLPVLSVRSGLDKVPPLATQGLLSGLYAAGELTGATIGSLSALDLRKGTAAGYAEGCTSSEAGTPLPASTVIVPPRCTHPGASHTLGFLRLGDATVSLLTNTAQDHTELEGQVKTLAHAPAEVPPCPASAASLQQPAPCRYRRRSPALLKQAAAAAFAAGLAAQPGTGDVKPMLLDIDYSCLSLLAGEEAAGDWSDSTVSRWWAGSAGGEAVAAARLHAIAALLQSSLGTSGWRALVANPNDKRLRGQLGAIAPAVQAAMATLRWCTWPAEGGAAGGASAPSARPWLPLLGVQPSLLWPLLALESGSGSTAKRTGEENGACATSVTPATALATLESFITGAAAAAGGTHAALLWYPPPSSSRPSACSPLALASSGSWEALPALLRQAVALLAAPAPAAPAAAPVTAPTGVPPPTALDASAVSAISSAVQLAAAAAAARSRSVSAAGTPAEGAAAPPSASFPMELPSATKTARLHLPAAGGGGMSSSSSSGSGSGEGLVPLPSLTVPATAFCIPVGLTVLPEGEGAGSSAVTLGVDAGSGLMLVLLRPDAEGESGSDRLLLPSSPDAVEAAVRASLLEAAQAGLSSSDSLPSGETLPVMLVAALEYVLKALQGGSRSSSSGRGEAAPGARASRVGGSGGSNDVLALLSQAGGEARLASAVAAVVAAATAVQAVDGAAAAGAGAGGAGGTLAAAAPVLLAAALVTPLASSSEGYTAASQPHAAWWGSVRGCVCPPAVRKAASGSSGGCSCGNWLPAAKAAAVSGVGALAAGLLHAAAQGASASSSAVAGGDALAVAVHDVVAAAPLMASPRRLLVFVSCPVGPRQTLAAALLA